jgi:hypothetical protein
MTQLRDRFPERFCKRFTPFPPALLEYRATLGLDARDLLVVLAIERHRWRFGEPVQIGLRRLAREAGLSLRVVQRITAKLDRLGLVLKSQPGAEGQRGRSRSQYDLDPLWWRLDGVVKAAETEGICAPTAGAQIAGDLGATSDHLDATFDDLRATHAVTRTDFPEKTDPPPPSSAAEYVADRDPDATAVPSRQEEEEEQQQDLPHQDDDDDVDGGGEHPPDNGEDPAATVTSWKDVHNAIRGRGPSGLRKFKPDPPWEDGR